MVPKLICVSVPDCKNFKKFFLAKMVPSAVRPSDIVNKQYGMPPGVSSNFEQMCFVSRLSILLENTGNMHLIPHYFL